MSEMSMSDVGIIYGIANLRRISTITLPKCEVSQLKKSRVNKLIYCYLVIMCLCMLVFILVDRRFARSFKRYAQSSRFGAT